MKKYSTNFTSKILKSRHAICTALCVGMIGSVAMFSSPAQAQQNVENRLNRLENEIQTLSQAIFRDGAGTALQNNGADGSSVMNSQVRANTELRLSQLEVDLRSMNGQIEEMSYKMEKMQRDLDRVLNKIELRLSDLEARAKVSGNLSAEDALSAPQATALNANEQTRESIQFSGVSAEKTFDPNKPSEFPTGQLGTITVTPAQTDKGAEAATSGNTQTPATNTVKVASLSPTELYDEAFSFLRAREYEKAQGAFQQFINNNPEHNLTPNAQYWLGETYYVRNDFERAARIFAEGYKNYPDGTKGPDNLLKLGMSLAGLGKNEDACLTFEQIRKQYSNAPTAILTRARQEGEKLSCPAY